MIIARSVRIEFRMTLVITTPSLQEFMDFFKDFFVKEIQERCTLMYVLDSHNNIKNNCSGSISNTRVIPLPKTSTKMALQSLGEKSTLLSHG